MTTLDIGHLPTNLADRRSSGWWGMVVLIATEATLFAALLAAYFYLRVNADTWPIPPIGVPDLLLPSIGTALLVGSSGTLFAAEVGRRRGNTGAGRIWLAVTTALGLGFLVVLTIEIRGRDYGVDTNAYGSIFYAITSLHGAHVVVGVCLLLFAQFSDVTRPGDPSRVFLPISLYWHFVDVVWVVLYVTLYLSEHLQ